MCTIPPRQRLPITRRLAIRTWRATHDLKSRSSTKKEYEKGASVFERAKYANISSTEPRAHHEHTFLNYFFSFFPHSKKRDEVIIVIPPFPLVPTVCLRLLLGEDRDETGTRGRPPRWHRDRVRRVPRQLLPQGVCVCVVLFFIVESSIANDDFGGRGWRLF